METQKGGIRPDRVPLPAGRSVGHDTPPFRVDIWPESGRKLVSLPHRLALFFVGIVVLSLATPRGSAAAACHSTCTQQLRECKRTCASGGQARRDCRTACAERSTCTAPGARIRTLAYVVNECASDPQGRLGLKQKLLIRRGNCDPVTVMEVATSNPLLDPLGLCRIYGGYRVGGGSAAIGVFQRMAMLPDDSGVVFEVTSQLSLFPSYTPKLPEEGIFFVRTDGQSPPRRLGDASRAPLILAFPDPSSPGGLHVGGAGNGFAVSPDGRKMAFIDFGPAADGHEAQQVFVLDLRSGQRTQLTHQAGGLIHGTQPGLCCLGFPDNRTIVFDRPVDSQAFQVGTDGRSPEQEIPSPTLIPGAHIVPQFGVTGARSEFFFVYFPDRPPVNPVPGGTGVAELFVLDGHNVVQLTNFGRSDTGGGLIARGRMLFEASANPTGENPDEVCQLFSIDKAGSDLRQLTHLPSDGRPSLGCNTQFETRCTLADFFAQDPITGTVLFASSCDPAGGNPFGQQLFAIGPDGTGLRQLTNARGMTTDPDGTLHVELPGPFAYFFPAQPRSR
jgi:hypothetical protein